MVVTSTAISAQLQFRRALVAVVACPFGER